MSIAPLFQTGIPESLYTEVKTNLSFSGATAGESNSEEKRKILTDPLLNSGHSLYPSNGRTSLTFNGAFCSPAYAIPFFTYLDES